MNIHRHFISYIFAILVTELDIMDSEHSKVSYKGVTLEEDVNQVVWFWDISRTEKRFVRFTIAQFPTNDNTVATWAYFKLFKKTEDLLFRQNQMVCYRIAEVEKLLGSLEFIKIKIREKIVSAMTKLDDPVDIPILKPTKFDITDKEDEETVHWFFDVSETPKRKVRISYIMYEAKDPVYSSYIQFKLFTREMEGQPFTRKFLLNMTDMEFIRLCSQSTSICDTLHNPSIVNI